MITSTDVTAIIQAEHDTILNDYSWSFRKTDTLITGKAAVTGSAGSTGGTVTTSGTTVTGIGTNFTNAMVSMYIRIGSNTYFYRITAVASATSLTMEAAMGTDVTTAAGYTIFQHLYDLPSDFGRVTNITSDVRLVEWSRNDIDRIDPYRSSTATSPSVYSIRGPDPTITPTLNFMIEFWPVPSSARAMRIEYLKQNTLVNSTDVPLYRSDVLVWKSAESAAFFLHGKTGDQAWLVLADRYHQRYGEALQGSREDDLGRYAAASYVRDKAWDINAGRDDSFYLNRDSLSLRGISLLPIAAVLAKMIFTFCKLIAL